MGERVKKKERKKERAHIRNRPRPTRDRFLAALTAPDPNAVSLDRVFPAESACVAGVLADFHFFDLLAEGGAVSGGFGVVRGVWFREVWGGGGVYVV